jgi:hypothetical protein
MVASIVVEAWFQHPKPFEILENEDFGETPAYYTRH